jgi:predicted DCC family thiol-disulfide oxidoreductase YuxK
MVLSFDGICVLCNGFVRFLAPRDRHGRLRFASSTSAAGAAVFASCGQDAANPATVVLVDGEHSYIESEAIIRAIMALGGGWRLIAVVRAVPRPLRDAAYRAVARNRYRWFGKLDRCSLPGARWADRFVS